MRATIEITGTAVLADLLQDIISLLTGETDKNNLITAAIVLGSTSVTANTPSGWELWDADAGIVNTTTSQVVRAPCVDDPTQFKYMQIYMTYSSSYYRVYFALMEDWNAGTNTPTRRTSFYEIILGRGPSTSYGNTIFILQSTERYIALLNIGGSGGQNDSCVPCMEISRVHPCLAVGTGRLPAVSISTSWYINTSTSTPDAHMCRLIDDAGTTDVLLPTVFPFPTSSPLNYWTSPTSSFGPIHEDRAYDKDGEISYGAYLLQFDRKSQYGHVAGTSIVSNIYLGMQDLTGASVAQQGPVNEEICYLKNVGMVRVRHAQFDISSDASPRWLFRVEDE
jgi:hypothetical protein